MAEYGPKENEKKQYKDKFSIMHFNEKTNEYKVLSINPLVKDKEGNPLEDNKKGVFLGIRIGTTGQPAQKLTLMLSKGELAHLIMEATRIYNQDLG